VLNKTYPNGSLPVEIDRERNSHTTKLQTTSCYPEAGSSCTQEWLWVFTHANADKSLRLGRKAPRKKPLILERKETRLENAEAILLSEESDEEEEGQREGEQEEDQREQENEEELEREGADESAEEERDEDRLEQDEEEREREGTRLKGEQLVKVKKPKRKSP
jgi:hypothetical protein